MADAEHPQKSGVASQEEELLDFWRERDIFWKSLDARKDGPRYTFYDGPPFATGTPHYGHILASAIKDAVPRYQTMRGKYVERRWGWDCHGLPIENIVEKDLGISGKKDIEALGIDTFNDKARSKVLAYVAEWKKTIERMARWVDFDGSYKTMDNTYIESVWWALAELHKKGLLYEGTRVLPYCPRCETPIAQSEIAMDNSYKDISDLSVYVTFPLEKGANLLAWTTTPWTLPGNTGVAINPKLTYVEVEYFTPTDVQHLILAKDRLAILGPSLGGLTGKDRWKLLREVPAGELLGQSYRPPFSYFAKADLVHKENIWKIQAAAYVSGEEGSGIVHLAPAFGAEDMELAQAKNLPAIWHVDATGRFTKEVTDFAGEPVKPKDNHQQADIAIIKHLATAGRLFKKEKIVHAYPHCFRCETPLYYYAIPAWFIKIQTVKERLLALNEQINWIPAHLKAGRFGKSLAGAPDWNISRNRYWASPLPIWKCESCQAIRVVGSTTELADQLTGRNQFYFVRHSESTKNTPDINDTSLDRYPLTEEGQRQAEELGETLRRKGVTKIVASPIRRAQETAAYISQAVNIPVTTDDRLFELRTGSFEGQLSQTYLDSFADEAEMWRHRPPGGENQEDVFRRMREALIDLNTHNQGEVIVVVSHGDPLWFARAWLEGRSLPNDLAQITYPEKGQIFTGQVNEIDLHRPWIDTITLPCACSGTMRRIPEVFDCWFESGSMPYAAAHYPFENEDWVKQNSPGDFVAEYIAQTRTWFYYMHVLSGTLFDSIPFKNVVTTGNILAEDGQKMSKSKKNYPDPWLLLDRYGADALRFYLLSSSVMRSEDINFSEKGVDEVFKKVILRLKNVLAFYALYSDTSESAVLEPSDHVLDRWMMARLALVTSRVTQSMEGYQIDEGLRTLERLIDDLSVWYVRRSRERMRALQTSRAAVQTLRVVLCDLAKLLAPFTPFVAEQVFGATKGTVDPESVHLADWPEATPTGEQKELLAGMETVRTIVELGHAARTGVGIKVRQPLARATVLGLKPLARELVAIICDELNVKTVDFGGGAELAVSVDSVLTEDLRREGLLREVIRTMQALRKNQGLDFAAQVTVGWETDDVALAEIFGSAELAERLATTTLVRRPGVHDEPLLIDGRTVRLTITKD